MSSSPLGSTHGRTTSGVACHHRLWAAHTIERRRALHAIISLGQHTRLDDVRRSMTSLDLDNTHGRQRRAWNDDITAHGLHTRSADVRRGMKSPPLDNTHGRQRRAWHAITALGLHTRSNDVRRGMQSSPLGRTDSWTASSVACDPRPWTPNMVERRQAWHAIIAFG